MSASSRRRRRPQGGRDPRRRCPAWHCTTAVGVDHVHGGLGVDLVDGHRQRPTTRPRSINVVEVGVTRLVRLRWYLAAYSAGDQRLRRRLSTHSVPFAHERAAVDWSASTSRDAGEGDRVGGDTRTGVSASQVQASMNGGMNPVPPHSRGSQGGVWVSVMARVYPGVR